MRHSGLVWASAVVVSWVVAGCSDGGGQGGFGDPGVPPGSTAASSSSSGGASGGADGGTTTSSSGSSGSSSGASGGGSGSSSGSGSGGSSGGSSGSSSGGVTPGFDQFEQHNLDVVNSYRAMNGAAPLALDTALSTFALAGSQELSMDHTPHQHFITASNDGTLWTSGFTSQAGENQGDPNGWPQASSDPTQNELTQIDQIQQAMYAEGPPPAGETWAQCQQDATCAEAHGHYENIIDPSYTRLGVGLLEVGGMLYLTNDFSN